MEQMDKLEVLAEEIWDAVSQVINKVLIECELHGLFGILTVPNPSIKARFQAVKKLDGIFQLIIDSANGDYDVTRKMYNAKQQVVHLELLLLSAINNDADSFELAKQNLKIQCKH